MRYIEKLLVVFGIISLAGCADEKSPYDYYSNTATRVRSSFQGYYLNDEQVEILKSRAEHGDGAAAFGLSLFYNNYKNDRVQSSYWVKISANAGYPSGMYSYGEGLARSTETTDYKEARYWLEKATKSGDEKVVDLASFELGQLDKAGH